MRKQCIPGAFLSPAPSAPGYEASNSQDLQTNSSQSHFNCVWATFPYFDFTTCLFRISPRVHACVSFTWSLDVRGKTASSPRITRGERARRDSVIHDSELSSASLLNHQWRERTDSVRHNSDSAESPEEREAGVMPNFLFQRDQSTSQSESIPENRLKKKLANLRRSDVHSKLS